MSKKSLSVVIFSLIVLAGLLGYWFINRQRLAQRVLEVPKAVAPSVPPPALSAEEKEKVLSTLEARHKETLTPQQKKKILDSLSAPIK